MAGGDDKHPHSQSGLTRGRRGKKDDKDKEERRESETDKDASINSLGLHDGSNGGAPLNLGHGSGLTGPRDTKRWVFNGLHHIVMARSLCDYSGLVLLQLSTSASHAACAPKLRGKPESSI